MSLQTNRMTEVLAISTSILPYLLRTTAMGLALGAVFFAGLKWTVYRSLRSQRPALWLLCSLLLRMTLLLSGLYLLSAGRWQGLVAGLLGVIGARVLLLHFTDRDQERSAANKTQSSGAKRLDTAGKTHATDAG